MNENAMKKFINEKMVYSNYHTHVSMLNPVGKFNIDRKSFDEFWGLYMDEFSDPSVQSNPPIYGIAEKPRDYLPVLVDVDLKVTEDHIYEGDHLYTPAQLKKVVSTYQSVLKEITAGISDEDLNCVVLEKPVYKAARGTMTYLKNGFHLHFPYIILNKADQEIHLITRVKSHLKSIELFQNLGYDDSGSVIDKGYCTAPWLMYGCRKKENMDPYLITQIIASTGENISIEKAFENYKVYNLKEKKIDIRGKVLAYMPRILSIIPFEMKSNEIKEGLCIPCDSNKFQRAEIPSQIRRKFTGPTIANDEKIKLAKTMIDMVSTSRATDRNEWMTIGWILYNIFDGDQDGLEIWNEFSSRCDSYSEVVNTAEWRKMTRRNYSIGTLIYYASVDSPEEFAEYKKQNSKIFTKDAITGCHYDIAKIIHSDFSNEFICASVTNKLWYQYTGHCWEEMEDGVFLRQKISNEIVKKFEELNKETLAKIALGTITTDNKQILKVITNLKSAPFKANIMKECVDIFYDKHFKNKLDTNPMTISFKNGIYDLNTNKLRHGIPEDYISTSMPIDYIEYEENSKEVAAVHSFLEKVFPDKSVRDYFLDTSSDVFVGGNKQKIVLFWTGDGDNGKSVTQRLFEVMLGPLAIKFSTTLITGKKTGTGSANPELSRAGGGVRWAVLEEPDGDETINIGILKSLSGNDSYWARDLFQSGKSSREITPMFKLVFICNKLPALKHSDKAVWNRIRVIPFESTFIRAGDPCPETIEEQLKEKKFPMDNELYSKIPDMVQSLAWILLNHRKNNINKQRIEPLKVLQATQQYRHQNDVYRQYIEECLVEMPDRKIIVTDLYSDIRIWLRDGFPGHPPPSRAEVVGYFDKALGKQERGNWIGYANRKDVNSESENTSPL